MDAAKAVTLCRQAVDLAPRNAAYLDSLGWAYFRQGNLMEARANFRRALDLAPGQQGHRGAHPPVHGCAEGREDSLTPAGHAEGTPPGDPRGPPRSSEPRIILLIPRPHFGRESWQE